MSNRSIKKRRHRSDFQQYMEQREVQKELSKHSPLWKQAGYPTQASFREALAKAQSAKVAAESQPVLVSDGVTDNAVVLNELIGQAHTHGPDCNHE